MKEVKKFILVNFIVLVITVLGGFICQSNAMLAVGILDLLLLICSLCVIKRKENTKFKGIISSLIGFIFILGSLAFMLYVFSSKVLKPSFFILLFLFITLVIKYLVECFYTNINYQKKKGLLSYGTLNSSVDFVIYGILLLVLILSKVSKWAWFLKYADRVGTVLVLVYVMYKGFRLIINSFKYLESEELTKVVEDEITARKEVKSIERILVNSFGGVRYITIDINLNETISLVDINTFVITLQDYLLKYGDVVDINMVNVNEKKRKTKPKVRSLKQDARNSGSRNSKTSTKKKNTKKKNKKR